MAAPEEFQGTGAPIDAGGFTAACTAIGVSAPEIWAVLSVETSGCGFLPDRRPKILFERHYFSHLTDHEYDTSHPDISQPIPGGYGLPGAHQYDRLAEAIALDRLAALQSASWGLGQVMGSNCRKAGFAGIEEMVAAMVLSESAQLGAMVSFVKSNGIDQQLRAHDWAGFASRYNGRSYASHNYDGQLQHFFQLYSAAVTPDLRVRAAQIYLTYRGISPGGIDGILGTNTLTAVKQFQRLIDVTPTGIIDDGLLGQLSKPL